MLLESLPDHVAATLQTRNAWRRGLAGARGGMEFIVSDLTRWRPGSTVRVAFLDGHSSLHADIEAAVGQISDACNLTIDFGRDDATGEYRRWSESDTEHAAETRVSFDQGGYWSLVGTDSVDPAVGGIGAPDGGRPGQRSLNLGGYLDQKPSDWEGTVRHEFLHALSFHHAHQNLRGPCADEFRWDDDRGYQPTQNAAGEFVMDSQGRFPGIYTYLAGAPNYWNRTRVDQNLRTNDGEGVVVGPFDPASVMLYRFAPFFYKHDPSDCAPTGNGVDLSEGDRRGLALLYPAVDAEIAAIMAKAADARTGLEAATGVESAGSPSTYEGRVRDLLDEWRP
jgi:hypothetical protein